MANEAEAEQMFARLNDQIDLQNEKIAKARSEAEEQEEKMEEMEDTLLALAMALKELEDAVDAREPLAVPTLVGGGRRDSTTSLEGLIKANILDSLPVQLDSVEKYASCFGYLWKQSYGTKKGSVKNSVKSMLKAPQWKRRWFVMKEDGQVLYYKTMRDATDKKVTPSHVKLKGYSVQEKSAAAKPFAFSLVCGDVGKRPFVLAPDSESESERNRWMKAFRAAIEVHSAVPDEALPPSPSKASGHARSLSSTSLVSSEPSSPLPATAAAAETAELEGGEDTSPATNSTDEADATPAPGGLDDDACEGWLERRVKANVWVRRFYTLKRGVLSVLSSPDDGLPPEATFQMQGVQLDIVMDDDDGADGKELCFSLELPREGLSIFCSASEDEFGRWFSKLNNASQT